jgi:hypothetical protein
VYASNEGEFIVRLRNVFDRFRQYNITLNPKKCSFGLEEVEFAGHVIKPDGVSFSTEKREKVLDFPFPEKQKHLRSFLGLVNYFRDHVKGLSTMVKPLNDMVNPYKKNTQISWTPQMEQVFIAVQEAVGNCPKLFYVDPSLPIHVRTDTSDYGIGGYIFQLDGTKELPIRFISKALHKSQLNWSTIEKEAFAIFYTVTKFDFLLRDVKFVVETDHKNLTFLKTAQSAKVRRWQLTLQEFDCRYVHIPGADNVVADAFSRLVEHHPQDEVANPAQLTAMVITGNGTPSEQGLHDDGDRPVTIEPAIDAGLREKIKEVHNSVSGHFGVEYTRKVLIDKGIGSEGLRRAITKSCVIARYVNSDLS